jgi:hypothetical protein
MAYCGWQITEDDRERLLACFPPMYCRTIAEHVTLALKDTMPDEAEFVIVGYANDNKGVECFVVEVNGTTERPDGKTFHVTWSLEEERKPKESNDLLQNGFHPIERMPFKAVPFVRG